MTACTTASTVWFGPQLPVSSAVPSVYEEPLWWPIARPGVVDMSCQSRPSVCPLIQLPPSEIGFSVSGNAVV